MSVASSSVRIRAIFWNTRAVPVLALGIAVLVSGCASNKSHDRSYAHAGMSRAHPQGQVSSPQIVIEDDGLPSQSPPVWRTKVEPDDPSEPFSPNYGGQRAVKPEPMTAPPARRADNGTSGRIIAEDEQELLIMRAVAAHEQRRQ